MHVDASSRVFPRPYWIEAEGGALAILIRVEGPAALIRWATDGGGYVWRDVTRIRRRPECDRNPIPAWLAHARASRRPGAALYALCGLAPMPPDDLAPQPAEASGPRLVPVPMFESDAEGRPID
jgi:hypothetical protein